MNAITVESELDMTRLGARLASLLRPGDTVWLSGEMGAGKSVLARGIARAMGVEGAMPSPSFTILQSYEGAMPVRHFDLYRLEDPAEFYEAGLDEQIAPDALSLVEWPDRSDYAPIPRLEVCIDYGPTDGERRVSATCVGMSASREADIRNAFDTFDREKRGNV